MKATTFQRTGIVLLLIGIVYGMHMGMSQDFTYAPAHAHLNLVGGVLMFVAGLFYASRPDIPARAVAAHYLLHAPGAVLLTAGIFGSVSGRPWAEPVVGTGAVLVLLAMLVFAFNVFRSERAR